MASIHDVAKLAHVSISTVSRVLTHSAPVEKLTRMRVEAAIEETKYRPNITAQSLRSKSGQLIGLLLPDLGNTGFTSFINSIVSAAEAHGFGLIISDTKNDPEKEAKSIDSMLRRNVDGIILSRVSDKSMVVDQFIDNKRNTPPMIVVDRALTHEAIPNVVVDNYKAGYIAGNHLASIGCKNIVCACGPNDISLVRERNLGFSKALAEQGIIFDNAMMYESNFTFESGKEMVQYFFNRRKDIDGIWCHDDIIALGAMSALQRKGLRIPQDVALMGMDDIQYSRMCYPTLTTIIQPYAEMSETVISLINRMKNGEKPENYHIELDITLAVRESTTR